MNALEEIRGLPAGKYQVTATGLVISGKPTKDELHAIVRLLGHVEGGVQWNRGDAFKEDAGEWGEMYEEAVRITGLKKKTIENEVYVATRYHRDRRRSNLSWAHHDSARDLETDAEQGEFLARAEAEGWNRQELRQQIRIYKDRKGREGKIFPDAEGVTIIEGDALEILPTLTDKFNLLLTDPPYNVKDVEWDKIGSRGDYLAFTRTWLAAALEKMADPWCGFIFCSPHYMADMEMLLRQENVPLLSRIVWNHKSIPLGRVIGKRLISSWDPIFHIGTANLNLPAVWGDERFDVQTFAAPTTAHKDKKVHQTQKPIDLIRLLVDIGSAPGDAVLDPFGGGGTTAVAAYKLGRRCTIIEREPEFVQAMKERLSNEV